MKQNILKILLTISLAIIVTSLYASFATSSPIKNNIKSGSASVNNQFYRPDLVDLIKQVNESALFYYLSGLMNFAPRYTGTDNCNKAAEYIADEFQKMNLDVCVDKWRHLQYKSQNIIATHKGTNCSSSAIFVISAHYDTVEYAPGANDDGSGIAIMLTLANILSKYAFNNTIKFIAFSGEEEGMYGSQDYARKAYEKDENIIAAINMDTLGRAETEKGGKIVQLLCPDRNLWLSTFFENISKTYNEYIDLQVLSLPNHPCDHDAFTQYGYDAVMLFQYDALKYWHSKNDTIDHINFTYVNKSCRLILTVLALLAEKPIDLQVRIETPREGSFYLYGLRISKLPKLCFTRSRYGRTYILGSGLVRINVTSSEEIDRVIYCIDDLSQLTYMVDFYPTKAYQWRIRGYDIPLIGTHKIGVYVYTISGKVAYDEMDVTIFTLNQYYWRSFFCLIYPVNSKITDQT